MTVVLSFGAYFRAHIRIIDNHLQTLRSRRASRNCILTSISAAYDPGGHRMTFKKQCHEAMAGSERKSRQGGMPQTQKHRRVSDPDKNFKLMGQLQM